MINKMLLLGADGTVTFPLLGLYLRVENNESYEPNGRHF